LNRSCFSLQAWATCPSGRCTRCDVSRGLCLPGLGTSQPCVSIARAVPATMCHMQTIRNAYRAATACACRRPPPRHVLTKAFRRITGNIIPCVHPSDNPRGQPAVLGTARRTRSQSDSIRLRCRAGRVQGGRHACAQAALSIVEAVHIPRTRMASRNREPAQSSHNTQSCLKYVDSSVRCDAWARTCTAALTLQRHLRLRRS
jgi:hypothetical protein